MSTFIYPRFLFITCKMYWIENQIPYVSVNQKFFPYKCHQVNKCVSVNISGLYSLVIIVLPQYTRGPGFESPLRLFTTWYIWCPMCNPCSGLNFSEGSFHIDLIYKKNLKHITLTYLTKILEYWYKYYYRSRLHLNYQHIYIPF